MDTTEKHIGKTLDPNFKKPVKKFYSSEEPQFREPVTSNEHLLQVFMGEAQMLIPGTPEYDIYRGLETKALASCTGLALYIPQDSGAFLGIGHLTPSQGVQALVKQFEEQLGKAGVDFRHIQQQPGYIELIRGQALFDPNKDSLRHKISRDAGSLEVLFPRCRRFPFKNVVYSVLSGHLSSSMKLLKDGLLIIAGEGKAY